MKVWVLVLNIVLLLVTVSCSKYIDFSYDSGPEKLVINASISPQEGVFVKLTHSLPPTGTIDLNDTIYVENAKVLLIINDTLQITIPSSGQGGFYLDTISHKPSTQYHYRLQVETGNYGLVLSEAISIPEKPVLRFIRNIPGKININGDTCIQALFTIESSPIQLNYFYYRIETPELSSPWSYLKTSPFVGDLCEMTELNEMYLFNNQCLNRPLDTLCFEIQTRSGSEEAHFYNLKLAAIDQVLYKYCMKARQPSGNLELTFNEPHITYSNFDKGFGVFYGENSIEMEFQLSE